MVCDGWMHLFRMFECTRLHLRHCMRVCRRLQPLQCRCSLHNQAGSQKESAVLLSTKSQSRTLPKRVSVHTSAALTAAVACIYIPTSPPRGNQAACDASRARYRSHVDGMQGRTCLTTTHASCICTVMAVPAVSSLVQGKAILFHHGLIKKTPAMNTNVTQVGLYA
jgi:hypothetical protein